MKKHLKKEILKRAMAAFNCKKVNEIALLFNISPQNLNGYLDRETFFDLIFPEVYKRNINLDWIKTGQGEMTKGSTPANRIAEQSSEYSTISPAPDHNIKVSDLLTQTAAILESPTVFSPALKNNIEAFHFGIKLVDDIHEHTQLIQQQADTIKNQASKIQEQSEKIKEQDQRLKAIEERLPAVNDK